MLKYKMKVKKIIKTHFKKLIQSLFFLIYGKVKIQNLDLEKIKITKIKIVEGINVKKYNYQVLELKKGRVFTDYIENLSVIFKNTLVKNFSFQQINGSLNLIKNQTLISGTPKFKKKIAGTTLVLTQGASGHFNYAHWLFDIVPKLIMCSQVYDLKKIDFFYFSKLNSFQKETLKLMGIKSNKFIDADAYRHIQCEKLLSVTHPNYFKKTIFFAHSNLPKWIVYVLKKKLIKKNSKKFNYEKIFVDRSDSINNHCKIINNDEVIEFLKEKNYKIIQLSKFKFFDQISIFKNCKKIIAPHGAGLANLVFCRRKTNVLEIIPKNIKNRVYQRISKINKLNHKFIYLKTINKNQSGDMYLDLRRLHKF
jgi:capsular polysaccharide biosynthesis protein